MTNVNNQESSEVLTTIKFVGWVVLGIVVLIILGSIILFLFQLVAVAIALAVTAFIGWIAWMWVKYKWEQRSTF